MYTTELIRLSKKPLASLLFGGNKAEQNYWCSNEMSFQSLLLMMMAASTPGTQPKHVNIETITIDPHPLSRTASGGNKIASKTFPHPIL